MCATKTINYHWCCLSLTLLPTFTSNSTKFGPLPLPLRNNRCPFFLGLDVVTTLCICSMQAQNLQSPVLVVLPDHMCEFTRCPWESPNEGPWVEMFAMPCVPTGSQVWSAWRGIPNGWTYWEGWFTPMPPQLWFLTPAPQWVLIGYRAITPEGEIGTGVWRLIDGHAHQEGKGPRRVHHDHILSPSGDVSRKGHPAYLPTIACVAADAAWSKGQGMPKGRFHSPGLPKGGGMSRETSRGKGKGHRTPKGSHEGDDWQRVSELVRLWDQGFPASYGVRDSQPPEPPSGGLPSSSSNAMMTASRRAMTMIPARQDLLVKLQGATRDKVRYYEKVLQIVLKVFGRAEDLSTSSTVTRVIGVLRMAERDRCRWLALNLKPPGLG